MYYILLENSNAEQFYQEVERGTLQRCCDLLGNTIPSPAINNWVVDSNPLQPAWALPDNPPPAIIHPVIISRLDFRNRFNINEKIAIYTALSQSIELRIWLDDLTTAEYIDLSSARTIDGLSALVASGILSQIRMNEILNA